MLGIYRTKTLPGKRARGRAAVVVMALAGIATDLVSILSLGYLMAEWRALVVFSNWIEKLSGEDLG